MLRFRAWKLVRMISIELAKGTFKAANDDYSHSKIKYKDLKISYYNYEKQVKLFYKEQEIWLPLLCRLVLRRNVRKYFINQSLEKVFGV